MTTIFELFPDINHLSAAGVSIKSLTGVFSLLSYNRIGTYRNIFQPRQITLFGKHQSYRAGGVDAGIICPSNHGCYPLRIALMIFFPVPAPRDRTAGIPRRIRAPIGHTHDQKPSFVASPFRPIVLGGADVHLWRAFLEPSERTMDKLVPMLSEDELARAASFHFVKDREHFILSRGILRNILGRYSGINPVHLKFQNALYGKPHLTHEFARVRIQFNLSHTHQLALYAVTSNSMVGVDVEYVRK